MRHITVLGQRVIIMPKDRGSECIWNCSDNLKSRIQHWYDWEQQQITCEILPLKATRATLHLLHWISNRNSSELTRITKLHTAGSLKQHKHCTNLTAGVTESIQTSYHAYSQFDWINANTVVTSPQPVSLNQHKHGSNKPTAGFTESTQTPYQAHNKFSLNQHKHHTKLTISFTESTTQKRNTKLTVFTDILDTTATPITYDHYSPGCE